MKKLRLAVLMGGPSSERGVSFASGANIVKALRAGENAPRYQVTPIKFREPKSLVSRLQQIQPQVVFPVLHGKFGEDGTLQALLETLGLPYLGSGVLASALCMDKVLSSQIMASYGLGVPRLRQPDLSLLTVEDGSSPRKVRPAPAGFVVKPRFGGSSVGVFIIKNKKDLAQALRKAREEGEVIVQEYLQGREFTCGVLEFEKGKPFALPVTEIIPSSEFFDYKAKYAKDGSEEITPACVNPKLTKQIQQSSILAHQLLACRHISRSDFIFSRGRLHYLETNTMPGMTNTSLVPQAAAVAGLSMPELTHRLVQAALRSR